MGLQGIPTVGGDGYFTKPYTVRVVFFFAFFLWSLISEIDGPPGRQNWTELCHLWRRRFRLSYARAGELGGKALPHCTLNQEEQQGATILKQETLFIILTDS